MEYLNLIVSFVIGGGLTAFLNWRIRSKTEKVDFADKAMKFMEEQNDSLMKRIEVLEKKVNALETMQCKKIDCKIRIA
jgi:hypothetical protein